MIPRTDLKAIVEARLVDSRVLFDGQRYDAAQYLVGYAVELALKARFCADKGETEFPGTLGEFRAWEEKHGIRLDRHTLLELREATSADLTKYLYKWSLVEKWHPTMRYSPIGYATPGDTRSMIAAAKVIVGAL